MIAQIHMALHSPSCPWQLHLTAGTKVPSSSPCPRLDRALGPVLTVLCRRRSRRTWTRPHCSVQTTEQADPGPSSLFCSDDGAGGPGPDLTVLFRRRSRRTWARPHCSVQTMEQVDPGPSSLFRRWSKQIWARPHCSV